MRHLEIPHYNLYYFKVPRLHIVTSAGPGMFRQAISQLGPTTWPPDAGRFNTSPTSFGLKAIVMTSRFTCCQLSRLTHVPKTGSSWASLEVRCLNSLVLLSSLYQEILFARLLSSLPDEVTRKLTISLVMIVILGRRRLFQP